MEIEESLKKESMFSTAFDDINTQDMINYQEEMMDLSTSVTRGPLKRFENLRVQTDDSTCATETESFDAFASIHGLNFPSNCDPCLSDSDDKKSPKGNRASPTSLKMHRKRYRRKADEIERKFGCEFEGCYKSYGSESSLNNHIRKKHSIKRTSHCASATQPLPVSPRPIGMLSPNAVFPGAFDGFPISPSQLCLHSYSPTSTCLIAPKATQQPFTPPAQRSIIHAAISPGNQRTDSMSYNHLLQVTSHLLDEACADEGIPIQEKFLEEANVLSLEQQHRGNHMLTMTKFGTHRQQDSFTPHIMPSISEQDEILKNLFEEEVDDTNNNGLNLDEVDDMVLEGDAAFPCNLGDTDFDVDLFHHLMET